MTENFSQLLIWLLVALHITGLLFLLVGTALVFTGRLAQVPFFERLYIGIIAATAFSYLFTGACVITTWEKELRRLYLPDTDYEGGFIAHYLGELGIEVTDPGVFWFIVTVMTIGIVSLLYHRTRARTINSR
jgi:hypothetical protein